MKQRIGTAIALAGLLAIVACIYLVNPVLLIGVGGLIAVGVGNILSR